LVTFKDFQHGKIEPEIRPAMKAKGETLQASTKVDGVEPSFAIPTTRMEKKSESTARAESTLKLEPEPALTDDDTEMGIEDEPITAIPRPAEQPVAEVAQVPDVRVTLEPAKEIAVTPEPIQDIAQMKTIESALSEPDSPPPAPRTKKKFGPPAKKGEKRVVVQEEKKRKIVIKEEKNLPPKKRAKKGKKDTVEVVDIPIQKETVIPITVEEVEIEQKVENDPFRAGVAQDEEDLYLLKLVLDAKRNKASLPPLPETKPQVDVDGLMHAAPEEEPELEEEDEYIHPSGCARSNGYYKVSEVAKSAYLPQRNRAVVEIDPSQSTGQPVVASSRSARVATRRFVQGIEQSKKSAEADSDVFAFNQLRTRKKALKFSRSPIHDWGLYAAEAIGPGEMVIEYVGEVIRAQVADIREKWYEKIGIGSSYLFRVDDDAVVDATKKGSMARLINHCCTPNCTAKIITINGEKKVSHWLD
jgi:hypothetical protein